MKSKEIIIAGLVVVVFGVVGYFGLLNARNMEEVNSLRGQVAEVVAEKESLTAQIAGLRKQVDDDQQTQEELLQQISDLQERLAGANEIDTSDWLTYRNEEYGFEVEYPKEWTTSKSDDFAEDLYIRFKGEDNKMFIISVYNNNDKQLLGTYNRIKAQYEKLSDQVITYPKDENAIKLYITTSQITLDQQDETWNWFKSIATMGEAFLETKEYSYNFYFPTSPAKPWYRSDELAILKELLKSFKILDIQPKDQQIDVSESFKQQINISNWQTYRNEKYEFEIKYPEEWFILNKDNDFTKEQDFTFANFKGSDDELYEYAKKNPDFRYRSLFINIYPNNNERAIKSYNRVKAQYKNLANKVITYQKDKDKIILYIITKRSPRDQMDDTWDWALPKSKTFSETKNYSYIFNVSSGYSSDERKKNLEMFKILLKSFEFINK